MMSFEKMAESYSQDRLQSRGTHSGWSTRLRWNRLLRGWLTYQRSRKWLTTIRSRWVMLRQRTSSTTWKH